MTAQGTTQHLLVQEKCRYRHPLLVKSRSQPSVTQRSSSKADRGAAWRAYNASRHAQQTCSERPEGTTQALGQTQDSELLIPSRLCQLAASKQHAVDTVQPPRGQPLPDGHPCPPASHTVSPVPPPAVYSLTLEHSLPGAARSQASEKSFTRAADIAHAPARRKPSYARQGTAGAQQGHDANNSCSADTQDARLKRFKIRNRFRAGSFRR